MSIRDWTHEDEQALKAAAIQGLKDHAGERWPTIRELSGATGFAMDQVCAMIEGSHEFTPEGVGGPRGDPPGGLPLDPDQVRVAVYDYEAHKDPGHPGFWQRIDLEGAAGPVGLDLLKAAGYAAREDGIPARSLAQGRVQWLLQAKDGLTLRAPDADTILYRFQASFTNGRHAGDTLVLDTRDVRDGIALAEALAAELAHPDPARQPPSFTIAPGVHVFNPFRQHRPLSEADRRQWNGIASVHGTLLNAPAGFLGEAYAAWRDGLARKALGARLRLPSLPGDRPRGARP